jgi:hydroxypyruvate reductase/glycerate 2-kinase
MADSGYFKAGARLGLSIDDFLKDNDAHHYFQAVGGLLETGPTGTNVMDIVILLIDREDL